MYFLVYCLVCSISSLIWKLDHFMSAKLCSNIYKTGHFYRARLNIFISRESSCLSILKCGKWKVWSDTWDKNCKKWKNFSSKLTPLFSMFGVLLIVLQEQSKFCYGGTAILFYFISIVNCIILYHIVSFCINFLTIVTL